MPTYKRLIRGEDISSLTLENGTYFCSQCTGVPTDGYLFNLSGVRFFLGTDNVLYSSYYIDATGWSIWNFAVPGGGNHNARYGYLYFLNNAALTWDKDTGKLYLEGTTTSGTSIQREL